ncbi:MAG: PD-(D/E)XK nuclease family protein, partial [Fervidobacterium pennivorans]
HSKISAYQSCPLYFYYLNVANVTRPQKFSERVALSNGIIVHRVLKRFFEKQPIQLLHNNDLKRKIEDWIREEYKSIFPEGVWKYSIPQEMKVHELSRELLPLLSDFISSGRIINLNAKSMSTSTHGKTKTDKLVSIGTLALEKEFKVPFGSYSLLARVDRIDKTEIWNEQRVSDLPNYAIIDYKFSSSSVEKSQIEQLILYDFIISRSNDSVIPSSLPNADKIEVYLIFLSTKRLKKDDNSYKYIYIKSERVKSEDKKSINIGYLLPKKNGNNRKKTSNRDTLYISDKEFEEWLMKLINNISKVGDFTPVFIDSNPKSFAATLKNILPEDLELDIAKGSLETRKCRSKIKNNSCPYEQLCSIFEIYGLRLLEE